MIAARDRGMVTAELAMCLPVLVLVLAFAVGVITTIDRRARLQDAAAEAARAFARGDPAAATRLLHSAAPGATVTMTASGSDIEVVVTDQVHLLTSRLPTITITAHAVAAIEPATSARAP